MLSFIFLDQHHVSGKERFDHFRCTEENINEIQNMKIKRFFANNRKVYIVTEDRVIFFSEPEMNMEDLNSPQFIIQHPFYNVMQSEPRSKEKVVGYVLDQSNHFERTHEIYLNNVGLGVGNISVLEFNGTSVGKRGSSSMSYEYLKTVKDMYANKNTFVNFLIRPNASIEIRFQAKTKLNSAQMDVSYCTFKDQDCLSRYTCTYLIAINLSNR